MTKRPEEVALLAESGRLLASVFAMLDRTPLAGLSTLAIDAMVERFITDDLQARPASKGQYGYGFVLNASVNHVVCHGVPSPAEVLRQGDIVNLDITLEKNGYIADSSKTYLVGTVDPAARRLVQTTYDAMWLGIQAVRPGARLGDIGWAIERHAKRNGYSVVRNIAGTASVGKCTKNRRSCISANPAPAWCCARTWSSRSSRCSTRGGAA